MILLWMLYLSVVASLMAAAARLTERLVRQLGGQIRGLWILAIVASLLIPFGARWSLSPIPPQTSTGSSAAVGPRETEVIAAAPQAPDLRSLLESARAIRQAVQSLNLQIQTAASRLSGLNSWLLLFWVATSFTLAALFAKKYSELRERSRHWPVMTIDGYRVRVSPTSGPAVMGFVRGEIVIPEWVLDLSQAERKMVLTHEEEHVRVGDSRVLLLSLASWILMPWNPGLWYSVRGVRRAVELDCDSRVLARGVDARSYGRLLLDVMTHAGSPGLPVAALSDSPSFLERRIELMVTGQSSFCSVRNAAALMIAATCVFTACRADQPVQPGVGDVVTTIASETPAPLTPSLPNRDLSADSTRAAVETSPTADAETVAEQPDNAVAPSDSAVQSSTAVRQTPAQLGSLRGIVTDRSGNPIATAQIWSPEAFEGGVQKFDGAVLSGADGSFSMSSVPAGTYSLVVRRLPFLDAG